MPDKEQKVLEFVEELKSEQQTSSLESDFVPQTPLAKKLWEIRQRAIAAGLELLNEDEIEQELALRRGGRVGKILPTLHGASGSC